MAARVVTGLLTVLLALAQSTEAAQCDACGDSASYDESVDTFGFYEKRTIRASGCPNHYSYCTGKGEDGIPGCGNIGEEGTMTEATEQDHVFEIPANPVIATEATGVECEPKTIAIALNGVSIYPSWVGGTCDLLNVTDDSAEWFSFDYCSGHPSGGPRGGDYHYHFPPSCLLDQAEATNPTADGHSPQVGWSLDGFPVYGPKGPRGTPMDFTALGCTGGYCLDACSGQALEVPDLDSFKYRYYLTGATSDLHSLPADPKPGEADYPFTLNCYVGCTWDELSSEASKCTSGTSGVADNHRATALGGYTAKYLSSAAGAADMLCGNDSGNRTSSPSSAPSSRPPAPTSAPSSDRVGCGSGADCSTGDVCVKVASGTPLEAGDRCPDQQCVCATFGAQVPRVGCGSGADCPSGDVCVGVASGTPLQAGDRCRDQQCVCATFAAQVCTTVMIPKERARKWNAVKCDGSGGSSPSPYPRPNHAPNAPSPTRR